MIASPSQLSPRASNKAKKNAAKYRASAKQNWRDWGTFEEAIASATLTQIQAWQSFEQYRLVINNHKTFNHMRVWQSALNTGEDSRYLQDIAGVDTLILSPRESAKAQPLTEPVLTPDGWRLMGELKVGDRVTAADGNITQITRVSPQGVKQNYKITFDDGATTYCSINHLWQVLDTRDDHIKVLPLNDLFEYQGDRYLIPAFGLGKSHQIDKLYQRAIANIEYVGNTEMQCITIAHPSQLYVTRDYVITHNSTYLAQWVSYQYGMHLSPWVRLALKVLGVSYNIDTAMPRSRQIQAIIESTKYQEIFPWCRPSKRKWGEKEWMLDLQYAGLPTTEEQYSYVCAGLTGAINSRRCLVGGTMIKTEIGDVPISELKNCINTKVLTFNERTKQLEWHPITGFAARSSNRILEIRTSSGRNVQCTPDHPFFVLGQGYKEAHSLVPGDTVVVTSNRQGQIQLLLRVQQRNGQEKRKQDLQGLLSISKKNRVRNYLQNLQKDFCSLCIRLYQETLSEVKSQFILLSRMHLSKTKEDQTVQGLQNTHPYQRGGTSWGALQGLFGQASQIAKTVVRQKLPNVRSPILPSPQGNQILFKGVCEQSALTKNGWHRQQSLQARGKLQQRIFNSKRQSDGEGRTYLRGVPRERDFQVNQALREAVQPHGTPYQPRPSRRSHRKFGDIVQKLPYYAPQDYCGWESDTISVVTELRGKQEQVYDIEVAGNHNFFANEILSHNCHLVLLDDLVKSPEAIRAQSVRDAMVSNWENVIQFTRYDGSRAVCLGTRMTADDIYCTTFTTEKGWNVIEQSALLEREDGTEYSFWEPEHDKAPGMPLTRLQEERERTPIAFSFQRQNRIVRVKEQSINPELIQRGTIPTRFDTLVVGVDLSAGRKESNDYTAITLGGLVKGYDNIPHQYWVIDCWEDRIMGNIEKLDAVIEMWGMWCHLLPTAKYYDPETGEWSDRPESGLNLFFDSSAYGLSLQGDYESYILGQKKITDWRVHPVPASGRGDKLYRLRKHTGLFTNKLVHFNLYGRTMPDGRRPMGRLIQQITEFGSTSHDDLADSFELCMTGLRSYLPMTKGNY